MFPPYINNNSDINNIPNKKALLPLLQNLTAPSTHFWHKFLDRLFPKYKKNGEEDTNVSLKKVWQLKILLLRLLNSCWEKLCVQVNLELQAFFYMDCNFTELDILPPPKRNHPKAGCHLRFLRHYSWTSS